MDCPASAAASAPVVLVSMAPAWISGPGRHIGKIPGCTLILSPGYQECPAGSSWLTRGNKPLSPGRRARVQLPADRRGSSPACECLLAFCGRGAKGPSRSLPVGQGNPACYGRATLQAPEILAPAIDLARQLLAGFRYRLRDPVVIHLRLGGGKWRWQAVMDRSELTSCNPRISPAWDG